MLSQSVWKRPEASVLEESFLPPLADLAGEFEVVLDVVLEVVGIDEVLAGVVGRVDVDELHLAGVGFLEELEDFEVVALDHEVLGGVPVHAVFRARTQGAGGGGEGELAGAAFAVPVEAVFLLGIGDGLIAHELLEHVQIHGHAVLALGDEFGEERPEPSEVLGGKVGGLGFRVVGGEFFHETSAWLRR